MDRVLDPIRGLQVSDEGGTDAHFMDRALVLAWRAAGRTDPNPLVGSVVIRDGRVVGEGFHAACGGRHAEVEALDQAGKDARGSTLYVSLEPCAHHGRTPPCVDRIVEAGVSRVVAATMDPDPRVSGRGFDTLRHHGIDVEVGCRVERALAVNLPYFKRKLAAGPAVTLKMATTLDGRIASAPGRRDAITGEASQSFVHQLRAAHDAVAVGVDTLIVDRPRLDCRTIDDVRDPHPVVFDTNLRSPSDLLWSREGRVFYVVTRNGSAEGPPGAILLECPLRDGRVDVTAAMQVLSEEGIDSLLVEGGAGLFRSFLESDRWDVMHILVGPKLFGQGGVPLLEEGLSASELPVVPYTAVRMGDDYCVSYFRAGALDALRASMI